MISRAWVDARCWYGYTNYIIFNFRVQVHVYNISLSNSHVYKTYGYSYFCAKIQLYAWEHRTASSWQNNEYWVFGMVDVSQSPSLGVMKVVPDRTAATLFHTQNIESYWNRVKT